MYSIVSRVLSSIVTLVVMSQCELRAQVDFAALDALVTVKLGEKGQLLLSPDPSYGSDDERFTPLVDPTFAQQFANGGVLGWLAMVYQGDCDLASMADGEAILRRLGLDDDVSLFQAMQDRSTEPGRQLLRLLSVRLAQDRNLRAAIGVLAKELEHGVDDRHLRRAMHEALAVLRGERWSAPQDAIASIAELAARLPSQPDALLYIDAARLPSGRPLLRWGRELGMQVTQKAIRSAGGTVSACTWAGAVQMAEGMAAVPYEFARRFGNHRVDRGLMAFEFDANDGYEQTIALSGVFDSTTLRDGLREAGLEVEERDDRIGFDLDGSQSSIGAELAIFGDVGERGADAERAAELAKLVAPDDAQIAIWIRAGAKLPYQDELPQEWAQFGVPRRVALWLPQRADGDVKLHVEFATETTAKAFERLLGAAPRDFESWLDQLEDSKPLEPVLGRIERMKWQRDGVDVHVTLPFDGMDLGSALRALAASE